MDLHVVSIECSLTKPDASLGDAAMCQLFHRVPARCPLLHLFGHVSTRRHDGDASRGSNGATAATAGVGGAVEQHTICVHVHGVYPYFMVEQHDTRVSAMQFGAQLETVAVSALRLRTSAAVEPPQVLHHVEVVRLLPFYGYHARPRRFFKVSVIDPAMVRRLADLLRGSTHVAGRRWDVYEAHTPFHFQFMVDYGVKGMAPFRIPVCTARAPLPVGLQTAQLHIAAVLPSGEPPRLTCAEVEIDVAACALHQRAVLPSGEPPRLTCAEVEIDVAACALHQRGNRMEPGENLLSVRRSVRDYFADYGVDDTIRRGAGMDTTARCCSVADLQRCDPAVAAMQQRAIAYLRARTAAVVVVASADPNALSALLQRETPSTQGERENPASAASPHNGITQKLLEEMRRSHTGTAPLVLSASDSTASPQRCDANDGDTALKAPETSSTSSSLSQNEMGEAGREGAEEEEKEDDYDDGERSLLSSNSSRVRVVDISDAKLDVGDSVVLLGLRAERDAPSSPTVAKITALGSGSVRLQWYLTLGETHLADSQRELERRGRWLSKGVTSAAEELLLGDVEDDNPVEVLAHASRVAVRHSVRACTSDALLCRYRYHVSEQRLSPIPPCAGGEFVVFPAALLPQTAGCTTAGVVDEGEELLSASSSSTLSSSSVVATAASVIRGGASSDVSVVPGASQLRQQREAGGVSNTPVVLQRSVSKVRQQVVQSQLSLLLSCAGSSPRACRPLSLPEVASGGADSQPSSSVQLVDTGHAKFLLKFRENPSRLQPCCIAGDIPRNFRWIYDRDRNCMVVSAASWPFATPTSVAAVGDSAVAPVVGADRASVPLLTHIAPSQATPPERRGTPSAKQTWRPHASSNVSHSLQGGAYVTCALRVMCVEVLIRRQRGAQHVAQEQLLAVALGRTTTTAATVSVRLFCVSQAGAAASPAAAGGAAASRRSLPLGDAVDVVHVPSESHLLRRVRRELRGYDPDIILSWDGAKYGAGLLALRYRAVLQRSLARDFSRLTTDIDIHSADDDDDDDNDGDDVVSAATSSSSSSLAGDSGNSAGSGARPRAADPPSVGDTMKRLSRRFGTSVRIAGRVVIDLGKQLSKELQLPSHTLQMAHQKLFHGSLPYFTDVALAEMYTGSGGGSGIDEGEVEAMRRVALSVLLTRAVTPHHIAQHLHFYTRTAEFSRMYGILFHEVLSRGSQHRVEATLHRMAKPIGYAMLSPSLEQVHRQPRLQSMPLIMQPRSGFYKSDPVVVLDFRSLYPSIVIAYNICYSTCLGSVAKCGRGRLGVLPSYVQADPLLLSLLADEKSGSTSHRVTFAPNSCMFLTPETREGVLPRMLRALLETRFEVQAALKHVAQPRQDVYMQRVLHEQQLAIKMLANTTYGYTAASFTGRMPCADIADAIVLLGRQTLERAMRLISGHPTWKAEVVYGDTDSLFVRLPGRTKEEAFLLGEQMAQEVTAVNPSPIQLQFEKVLLPCLLLVKKRYVGYAYFKPEQQQPQFLAKGIETVRRDQCAATSRLAASMIHALFTGSSVEALRARFYAEVGKLQRGECSPADCIFRRAVRLGRYRSDSRLPLGARLALQLMEKDVMHTPYWRERMPYVVVQPIDSARLRDQVVHPQRLLSMQEDLRINSEYYIMRHIIPTLDRMFYLVGVSCASWYAAMPRRRAYRNYFDLRLADLSLTGVKRTRSCREAVVINVNDTEGNTSDRENPIPPADMTVCRVKKRTLDAYYQQTLCVVCLEECANTPPPNPPICSRCLCDRTTSAVRVVARRCGVERRLRLLETACLRCIGTCGEAGGPSFVAGMERDMEDMHFAIPRRLAAAQGEELRCLSIDCHLSFEKRQLFRLYSQLMAIERYVTSL
ncbi:DNA polymerase zeta catalytic subunit [Trypanosoma grayi]|uniref:DNA polymerase zeta catalytic subunit n=1 Tax=Trypanosoma grayi TaxID=71804 RepID=UPI0004F3F28A|nr:DNA polymerase zeta catalytic subunit [Trypanosoma grayi]KEG14455.1 DNA polymerase zeta catalytic subunit [Trypanosoma grayi]